MRVLAAVAVFTALLTTTSEAPQDAIGYDGGENSREAYFNGSAFLKLASTISVHRQSGLSFRTCDGGKLFTQTFGSDSISLEVTSEGLLFVAIIDQRRYEARLNARLLNNAWQNVNLLFRLGNFTLSAAGHTQVIANASYNSPILNLPDYEVNGSLTIGEGFKGCILQGPGILFRRNDTVNNGAVFGPCPLDTQGCGPNTVGALSAVTVSTTDFCHNEPCMMHGACVSRQDRYECHCYARYSGNNCQIENGDPCKSSPCQNGGKCTEDSDGNYSCTCSPGFTGRLCESQTGETICEPNPCKNEGTCTALAESEYKCQCSPGWTGTNCETNINECIRNPCRNGGICVDGINNYTCRCDRTGYRGFNCEVNIDECLDNPCLNNGECFDNYGGYICSCPMGFEGQNCEFNLNECLSTPCGNGGSCVDDVGSYHCNCISGFSGRHCELHGLCENAACPANSICIDDGHGPQCVCKPGFMGFPPNCTINYCASNPCMNGGSCTSDNDGFNCTCTSEWKGSTCKAPASDWCSTCGNGGTCIETVYAIMCQCPRFWTGPQCDQQITCDDLPCKQASACHDYPGGYYCNCDPGYTGPDCSIDLDECASDPCRNGAHCIDDLNSYYCQCLPGYTGKNCQINIDECLSQPCQNGGICVDKTNGYTCNCTRDFMGSNCEREYNACEINPCKNNGTCSLLARSRRDYVCECPAGFNGKICDNNVDDCVGAKCPDDRVCVDGIAGYECICREGYQGPNCTSIVDHCASNPCNNGTCIDLGERFECHCKEGYTGTHCDEDVNECEMIGASICNNGICVNTDGGYDCFCRPGFSGDHCDSEIDECLCGPCKNNATCKDKINSFECICPPGYTGKTCDTDIDECASDPCLNGATCVDQIDTYTCICLLGFAGSNCQTNIDDCKSSPCANRGICIDGINSYTCNCSDTGFDGLHCENNIDDCLSAPCVNGGTCVDGIKSYTCDCYAGYKGTNCETDIAECESSPCQYNGTCLERSNQELYKSNAPTLPAIFKETAFSYANASGYECICVQGVLGRNCETNINECESSPCRHGTCVDRIGGYNCDCEIGFEGEHCQDDIDECKVYEPCEHGGICLDQQADYNCTCKPEYGGKNCSVLLIGCEGSACKNGGTCKPYLENETEHHFNCTCPNGFHGDTCENITSMSLSGTSYVMVNTTRDEGYDIQFHFRTTLPNGLIAMGKGMTYYILELVNGKLNLHSSILNKWEGVFIGSGLNDSNWQKVFVAINTSHLVLSANEEQTIYPININEGNSHHTSFPTTFIGGTTSDLRRLTHGPPSFVGCYEDVVINGEWVYTGLASKTVAMVNVEPGCAREEQCAPNPCKNGGHCTDRWRDFSCSCERPYLGHTCQYNMTAATFGHENITDGYVTVKVTDMARRAIRSIVDISMFIRTRQDTGDIFYLGSESSTQFDGKQEKPYIRALLEHGELLVKIQFNGSEAYAVGGVKLNEGNYHLIQVVRNVTLVQVKINGTEYFRKTIGATGQSNVTVLYLGGLPQTSRYSRQADGRQMEVQQSPQVNFKGIIQDVQISNGSKTMVVEFYPLKAMDIPTPIEFGTVTFDRKKVLEGVVSDAVCDSNPCYHNGTCHVTWNDFWCKCPRGYTGKMCQEMEFCQLQDCPTGSTCQNLDDGYECLANATLNGIDDSFTYTYKQTDEQNVAESTIDSIEITYRSKTGGVLMHIVSKNGDQSFVVSVVKDNITISWNLDVDNRGTLSMGKSVPDGNWTSIVLKLNNDSIECGYANSNDETIPISSPHFSYSLWYELLIGGTVTLGGLGGATSDRDSYAIVGTDNTYRSGVTIDGNSVDFPDHMMSTAIPPYSMASGDSFKGCLGVVRIGSMLLHYFTYDEVYNNAKFTPTEYLALEIAGNSSIRENIGCRLCFDTDCKNDGHCLDKANSYVCECMPGYIEDDCSVDKDECIDNQCQNGATCKDAVARYYCECIDGWEGDLCDKDIDECVTKSPCHNGALCVNLPGSFACECAEEYTGKYCEDLKLITCENQPCMNGSTCTDVVDPITRNNFTCICMKGYEGTLCDTPYCTDKKQGNKCKYGGTCDIVYETPQCTCPTGYTGTYCETNIDDCVEAADGTPRCRNRGKCIDGVNSYTCDCTGTGYSGRNCTIDVDECLDPNLNCGNGQCHNEPGTYQCICDLGYCGNQCEVIDPCIEEPCQNQGTCECLGDSGYTCHCTSDFRGHNCTEQERSLGSQALDIAVIVGPIVGILLLIGAGSLIALFMMARKKRATRGTYSPSAQEFSNPRVEMDNVMKPPPEERLI